MCRIIVLEISGPATPADIGWKIRSTFLPAVCDMTVCDRKAAKGESMSGKVVRLRSNAAREMLPAFDDYEGEICDLVLAIKVVRLALEAEEDNHAELGTVRIALDHLEEMAAQLKQKWCEDYASVK